MSFLDKSSHHIRGIQNRPESKALSDVLGNKGFNGKSLGHFYSLLQRLSRIQGNFPLDKLQASILTFVADHGVAKSLLGANEVSSDSHATILHILAKPNFYYFQNHEKTLLGHRIVDLGAFQSNENSSTFWMHRGQGLINARVNSGSANFAEYPAMTTAECEEAFSVGQKLVEREIYSGVNFLYLNSFGRGDEISFFTLLAALQDKSLTEVWESESLNLFSNKVVEDLSKALRKHPISHDPFTILSFFGSFETAAMCGAIIKGAEKGIPLILSSPMAKAASMIVERIEPKALDYCIHANQGSFESERGYCNRELMVPYLSSSRIKIQDPFYLAGDLQVLQSLLEELART